MPPLFWLDVAVNIFAIVVASALFLSVLAAAPRNGVNRAFALFALMSLVLFVATLLLRLSLWLQLILPERPVLGEPQLWLQISVISLSATFSAALLFTTRFLGFRTRSITLLLSFGLVLTITVSVLVLCNQAVLNPRLDASGLVSFDVRLWGWVGAVMAMVLILWSLGLFWVECYRVRGIYLGWGLLILLAGTIVGGVSKGPIPIGSISYVAGMTLLGYGVIDQQLLNPLRERTIALEREVTERRKAEGEVKRRTEGLLAVGELALRCATAPPETDFPALIAEELRSISGALATSLSTYDAETGQLVTRYIAASNRALSTANKLLGRNLVGLSMPVSAELYERMRTQVVEVAGDLTEVTFGTVPQPVSEMIQQLLGIDSFTGLALFYGGELVGTAVIVTAKGQPAIPPDVARAFAHIAAVTLRRSEAEEARQESEARYRFIFDHAADGLVRIDEQGIVTDMNPSLAEMLGIRIEDYVGKRFSSVDDLLPQESLQTVRRRHAKRRISQGRMPPYELQIRGADGELLDVEVHARPTSRDGQSTGEIVAVRDISMRKLAEEAVRQAMRLESTATLAGGIAHQLNNLMVGVLGYAEMLKLDLTLDGEASAMLDMIAKSATRASELAQQLLAFARGGRYQVKVLDLNDTVQATIDKQRLGLPPDIQVVATLEPELWHIQADPTQMGRVVHNLFTNALEAIGPGGQITITTDNVLLDEAFCLSHPDLKPGSYVCLSVQDTGCGIDAENLPRIFDPFFTTKSPGRGLGLAAVYGIVKNHGGDISVQSYVGAGSQFEIYLPAYSSPANGLNSG